MTKKHAQELIDLVADKVLKRGLKLLKKDFKYFHNDPDMLLGSVQDLKDYVAIVKLLRNGNVKHACIKAWTLDTIMRESLPMSMINLINKQDNNG